MSSDYLWDGSGKPDPDVQRLEQALAPLRHRGAPPPLRAPQPRVAPRGRARQAVAAAAAVALIVGAAWAFTGLTGGAEFQVTTLAGVPRTGHDVNQCAPFGKTSEIAKGEWVVTDEDASAEIQMGEIGTVTLEPRTKVQVAETSARSHRLVLNEGALHASVYAPPRLFVVDTPSARAIDMGCEYDLVVVEGGGGQLHVTSGWVILQGQGREALVPAGTSCTTWPDRGPGTPIADDAPDGLRRSVTSFDRDGMDDSLLGVLATARRRDAITLVHLVGRVEANWNERILERLLRYSPPPDGVDIEAVRLGDRKAIETWRIDLVTQDWLLDGTDLKTPPRKQPPLDKRRRKSKGRL